jgi:natural product precursor
MKKQIKKLSVNKKTISNLSMSEMNNQVGGARRTYSCEITEWRCSNGRTCAANCA